ncbi:UDP-glucose 4-epimerase GalE [Thiorhodococcus minor]|uniref:UDP-glucose 4-epimerase n=1 Tax=Thiorhodococcus minor TaxID=57489 RepID=A0A6M0JW78_9GAMM|nr:UDP-glucose 4-epimerase GalE [Thiorhodococcus minor]NEV61181.1 UDP-glucose 4-epimerase GalE [Thiorhodococcus minor]
MRALVTGGAGYIGSHICVELLHAGMQVVVVDSLATSTEDSLHHIRGITGKSLGFIQADVRDRYALEEIFSQGSFDAVVHCAGLKSVDASVSSPLDDYQNTVTGTLTLCQAMAAAEVKTLVFTASAAAYGEPASVPVREDARLQAANPCGRAKGFVEDVLRDLHASDPSWRIGLMRCFNATGAHPSGCIGEDARESATSLLSVMGQVALGKLPSLSVFGNDYPTPDGTGVRDYIHVVDLARGHLAALRRLQDSPGVLTCNLGTGRGYSVLEMVAAFEAASGKPVPYEIAARRPGDIATCYADPTLAREELGWQAEHGIQEMVADAWRWQSANPNGYD